MCSHPLLAATAGEPIFAHPCKANCSVESFKWPDNIKLYEWKWACSKTSTQVHWRHFLTTKAAWHIIDINCWKNVFLLTYAEATVLRNPLNNGVTRNINKCEWACSKTSTRVYPRHFLVAMAACHEFVVNCRTNQYLFTRADVTVASECLTEHCNVKRKSWQPRKLNNVNVSAFPTITNCDGYM